MIKKIDHIVITTNDIEACLCFYECLGFESNRSGQRYEIFAGDFKINIHIKGQELTPKAQHVQSGSADLCFEYKGNISELKSLLEEQGIVIELGAVERHGVKGVMQSIYLRDPDGNLVELCSYE